jgi:hypothetical protein
VLLYTEKPQYSVFKMTSVVELKTEFVDPWVSKGRGGASNYELFRAQEQTDASGD